MISLSPISDETAKLYFNCSCMGARRVLATFDSIVLRGYLHLYFQLLGMPEQSVVIGSSTKKRRISVHR